jgi:hypothetical protein
MAPNPTDLILRAARSAAPQDEVVGSYEPFPVLNAGLAHRPWEAPAELARTF